MKINNDFIVQWEPKIQKFLNTSYVKGMEREDLAQELRIAIVKAAKGFDDSRDVSFHTYLHATLVNTLRTLISKAKKPSLDALSLDGQLAKDIVPLNISIALEHVPSNETQNSLELMDLLHSWGLTPKELKFVDLRIEGWTMEQITETVGESSYRLRSSLQEKFLANIETLTK
jgi:RNA polymerase sigma factor (sigma-70 family)|tara:strand:+ start:1298 stop:1816 length:519 start_codon:yes stop_codon:yes gene_type:complete